MVSVGHQGSLLRISNLTKTYAQGRWWEKSFHITALDGATLHLDEGRTIALVGRSGSGKTTLAMCAALLVHPDSGNIWFNGHNIDLLGHDERTLLRPQIQMCFQDSASISTRYTARQIIEEPLRIQRLYSPTERAALVLNLMETVGLPAIWGDRYVDQFSGGQRQRLAIARSLALHPTLLILDEPFVGLDNPARGQIVDLLHNLQARHSFTCLYILHDLELVRCVADSVAIMERGKIIEHCNVQDLFSSSGHSNDGVLDFCRRDFRNEPFRSSNSLYPSLSRKPRELVPRSRMDRHSE